MYSVFIFFSLLPGMVTFASFEMNTHAIRTCEGTQMVPLTRWDLSIDLDFFPDASPERPSYIRIKSNEPASTLEQTLVDIGDAPIYLALRLEAAFDEVGRPLEVIAPPESLSLVRWRKGEDQIWLKVQASTKSWISVDGTPTPLNLDLPPVIWTLGVSGPISESDNRPLFSLGHSNRTSNSTSNLVAFDTLGSILIGPSGHGCMEVSFFDDQTRGVEFDSNAEAIHLGEQLYIPFSDDHCFSFPSGGCQTLAFPWVSYNNLFDSQVVINNVGPTSIIAALTATRGDGSEYFGFVSIPANGFIAKSPAELFPEMEPGPGFSVKARATETHAQGRWVTYGKTTAGGQSPSQGTAVAADGAEVGETLLLGYLPQSGGFISAPVVVNLGAEPVDVTLYVFNSQGEALKVDRETIRGLQPDHPFALTMSELPADITADIADDVAVVAHAEGGRLAGVGLVFNENREPAIGNAQVIPWPPAFIEKR